MLAAGTEQGRAQRCEGGATTRCGSVPARANPPFCPFSQAILERQLGAITGDSLYLDYRIGSPYFKASGTRGAGESGGLATILAYSS